MHLNFAVDSIYVIKLCILILLIYYYYYYLIRQHVRMLLLKIN